MCGCEGLSVGVWEPKCGRCTPVPRWLDPAAAPAEHATARAGPQSAVQGAPLSGVSPCGHPAALQRPAHALSHLLTACSLVACGCMGWGRGILGVQAALVVDLGEVEFPGA